jgi:hypothetical protein
MMLTHWIAGTAPGVLFLVCCQCKRGVFFNTRLAVGFCAFIIGGAFVMRGTVRMGVSSITICCCNLTFVLAPELLVPLVQVLALQSA